MTLTFKRTIATILAILTLISVISAFAVNAATSDKTATGSFQFVSSDGEWNCSIGITSERQDNDETVTYNGCVYIGNKTTVVAPETIDGYEMNTIKINSTVKKVTLPKTYKAFWDSHFVNATNLEEIIFSRDYEDGDIIEFGIGMFENCKKLKTVVLPNLLPRGQKTSKYPSGTTRTRLSIDVSKYLPDEFDNEYAYYCGTELPPDTFKNCKKLTSVTLPDNLTEIGTAAFSSCSSLKSVTVPEGVKYCGAAFSGMDALEWVSFPDSLVYLASVPRCKVIVPENNNIIVVGSGIGAVSVEEAMAYDKQHSDEAAAKMSLEYRPAATKDFNIPVQDIIDTLSVDINNASYLSIYEGETKIVTDFTNDDLASLTVALQNNIVYTLRTYTDSDYTDYLFKVTSNGAITPYEAPEETTTQATTPAATQPTTKPVVPATTPTTPATTEPSESSNNNDTDDIDIEDNITLDAQTAKSQTVNKSYKAGKVVNIKINNAGNVKPKFKSSKKSVASVNSSGKITCRTKGTATITVTLNSVKVKYKIKVTNSPSIKVNNKKFKASTRYAIAKGKTIKVKITGKAKTVKNAYKSNKATVAKVTSNKTVKTIKIKGYKKGNATVTVKVNGYKSFKIKVKVK